MERRGEFGTWQMGFGKREDSKRQVDTPPGVSSPRVPLTTLGFRRRRSRFRKSTFYEAPLTNKIPLKFFFFPSFSPVSLWLFRERETFLKHASKGLSVFCSPPPIPWERVAWMSLRATWWCGVLTRKCFCTQPHCHCRGSIMIDADSWSKWSYPSSQEGPAGSRRRFQWKIFKWPFSSMKIIFLSSVTPRDDTKWPSITWHNFRARSLLHTATKSW